MNPFEMVVIIVALVMVASVIKTRYRSMNGIAADPDATRLREEVKSLKDRIAVLERLATDDNGARALDREIEKLR